MPDSAGLHTSPSWLITSTANSAHGGALVCRNASISSTHKLGWPSPAALRCARSTVARLTRPPPSRICSSSRLTRRPFTARSAGRSVLPSTLAATDAVGGEARVVSVRWSNAAALAYPRPCAVPTATEKEARAAGVCSERIRLLNAREPEADGEMTLMTKLWRRLTRGGRVSVRLGRLMPCGGIAAGDVGAERWVGEESGGASPPPKCSGEFVCGRGGVAVRGELAEAEE
mmetsp:Transcript_43351/g.107848  ORF Transcript_43351/g.107848 Transcript_43351/m.107848 type:complete len:230 (-) Transcript_43351:146-835(-)